LPLCRRLDVVDHRRSLILDGQLGHPHVAAVVVDEKQEVALAARSHRSDGNAQIPVDQLKHLCGPPLHRVRD
jgi:hypothetical protein